MNTPRPKLQILSLTDAAALRMREIVARSPTPLAGVRVGVKNAGCAGMAYTLDPVETPDPADDTVTDKGVTMFVESKALMFLLGSVIDHETTRLSSGFVFRNPNEVSACGCGESVQLRPAETAAHEA